MVWGGEVISLIIRTQREVNATRQSFDEVLDHHTELEMQLADLKAIRAQEERAAEAQKEALEAQVKSLMAEKEAMVNEKEALAAEKSAVELELEALTVKKTTVEVELEGTKVRAEAEIERLRSEAADAWGLGNCVAQFRANGYSEEEHPTLFLSVTRALEELPNDEEEADDCASGDETTPPNSPRP
ncbi:hypothetical protein F511_00613 [Dorcoceras hygrometricum]|nr:hypothetical protein F511_00613 [Dorcoceras hygrometricum]